MARRHLLLAFVILLCIPVPSDAYSFLGGVPEAARALEAHERFNQLVRQMDIDLAAGDAAGFGEMNHGAGAGADADTGSGILRWAVGSVFIASLVALFIGLVGPEQERLPVVRPVAPSPEITDLGLYLVLLVCITVVYICLRAAQRQLGMI